MDKETHAVGRFRAKLMLALAGVGGLAGAYGIGTRTSFLRTEAPAVESSRISPGGLMAAKSSVFAIPGSHDGKASMDRATSADSERNNSNQPANITRGNPFISFGSHRELHLSIFDISLPKPPKLMGDASSRIEIAKVRTQARIMDGQYIDINLSAQILTLFEDGRLLDSYVVSTGKMGMETPRGTYAVVNKFLRAWSKKYGAFMPYWMAITPGGSFGIHELPELLDGYKEGTDDLGNPVSHGCIRLGIGPAERVYNWAEVGTPVVVY